MSSRVYLVWYYSGAATSTRSGKAGEHAILVDVFSHDFDAYDCGWYYVREHKQENPHGWYKAEEREVKKSYGKPGMEAEFQIRTILIKKGAKK